MFKNSFTPDRFAQEHYLNSVIQSYNESFQTVVVMKYIVNISDCDKR